MKKIIFVLLFVSMTASAFSQIILGGNAPTVRALDDTNAADVAAAAAKNAELFTHFENALNSPVANHGLNARLFEMLGNVPGNHTNLIRSWSNASVFSSHGATQRALTEYQQFAVSLGVMAAGQFGPLPGTTLGFINDFIDYGTSSLEPHLRDGRDYPFGVGAQMWSVQVGLNMGFLVPNLFLGLRYGGARIQHEDISDIELASHSFGFFANYQVFPHRYLDSREIINWRGLNVGTGFFSSISDTNLIFLLHSISGPLTIEDASIYFNFDTITHTIPLEIMTAFRFGSFFQIPIGIGADFSFGRTIMTTGVRGNVFANPDDIAPGLEQAAPGNLSVVSGPNGQESPNGTNIKIMTGLGFVIGPMFIEFPFTYYFGTRGSNLGFTLAFSF